jgi:predicted alternative tryptophan synthase beta-subunit
LQKESGHTKEVVLEQRAKCIDLIGLAPSLKVTLTEGSCSMEGSHKGGTTVNHYYYNPECKVEQWTLALMKTIIAMDLQ